MTSNAKGTALVTGASSGIGAVYADRLAHRGYDLMLVARNAARMEALATRLRSETGRTVDVLPADLAVPADVAKVRDRLGSDPAITLLVNNAGISLNGGLLDNEPADLERLIAVNITAPSLLAAAAGRAFVGRKAGAIVNIASVLAVAPEMMDGVYSGSKAYLLNLSIELGREGPGCRRPGSGGAARRHADGDLGALGQGCGCASARHGDGRRRSGRRGFGRT